MSNDRIKSQTIKTDDFFVGKKHEKRMYLLKRAELVFNNIANAIEIQNKLEEKAKYKKVRSKVQRETRRAKRIYFYEFYLFDEDYDYKEIEKEEIPNDLTLKKNEFKLDEDFKGIFKGSELTLIEFLDSLYK